MPAKQLNQSLKRLGIDQIDLLQHHAIVRFDDADKIFAKDGAMEVTCLDFLSQS